jgi:3-isopropylmalate/(R)-2-methylmalate dehydratase small subunit
MPTFTIVESRALVLDADDIDTDQIIPARFLKTTERRGLGAHVFADWRVDERGERRPDFPLNATDAGDRAVLVAGRNFGCGSSREHAPWALRDFGIQVVVAPSFADIFRSNALKNGLLPVAISATAHAELLRQLRATPDALVRADLERERIFLPDGRPEAFSIPAFARRCLLEGVDQLGYLLAASPEIAAYERAVGSAFTTIRP